MQAPQTTYLTDVIPSIADAEYEFRIQTRRNRLAGLWAAETMDMDPDNAQSYARGIVTLGVSILEDEVIVERLHHDLTTNGIDIGAAEVEQALSLLEGTARMIIGTERSVQAPAQA